MICREKLSKPITRRMGDMPAVACCGNQENWARLGRAHDDEDRHQKSERGGIGIIRVWLVLVVCHATSAVQLYLSLHFSYSGFLQALAQHGAVGS